MEDVRGRLAGFIAWVQLLSEAMQENMTVMVGLPGLIATTAHAMKSRFSYAFDIRLYMPSN